MKLWGVTMVKNEEDIIYHTLLHMAEEGLDGIIVADNMSTDNTLKEIKKLQKLLKGSPCEIVIVNDNEPAYHQSQKMTALALKAKSHGADWIIPFDSDEIWYSHLRLKDFFEQLPKKVNIVKADLYNHYGSGLDKEGIPFQAMEWRDSKKLDLPKVAFKWQPDAVIGMGNHSVELSGQRTATGLEVRHFPYRSWEHFKRKAINGASAMEGLPKQFCAHWRSYAELIRIHGEEYVKKEVFEKYFWHFSPIDNGMVHDPAPFRRFNKL